MSPGGRLSVAVLVHVDIAARRRLRRDAVALDDRRNLRHDALADHRNLRRDALRALADVLHDLPVTCDAHSLDIL